MKEDAKKMKEISNEIKFLGRNKIKTTQDLFSYKNLVEDELKKQMKARNTLRRKRQKEENPEIRQKLCDEILDLSDKIKYLKQEVRYSEKIEEQNREIKEDMRELQKRENEEKSKKKGELER